MAYQTKGGATVNRNVIQLPMAGALNGVVKQLDEYRGALFSSSYEYPGRYTRWEFGFVKPPICFSAKGRAFTIAALNERGRVMLPMFVAALQGQPAIAAMTADDTGIRGTISETTEAFAEEERSKQPSVFSIIRAIKDFFYCADEAHLGLYGAFGYDLVFQFEDIPLNQERAADQQDVVLYFPDELYVADRRLEMAMKLNYEFSFAGTQTDGLPRTGEQTSTHAHPLRVAHFGSDHAPGEYANQVRRAIDAFACGDLFEVVPGQTLSEPCSELPSVLFERLKNKNPSPYGFLIHLGAEHLIGASPEMYVRVEGDRVETCPISGTIARGKTPIEDAERIRELINSEKDESELTMCTDVDRNDKSRICIPGSVKVIGRRQIEMYSRVIHTVDHVEGRLRDGYDSLDAFLTHMWAVTVTGAPKRAAIAFLERNELSPRRWYGGAIGFLGFNGDMNTGLTLRTIRLEAGAAEVRVGATLLFDSEPEEEELETRNKAAAMMDAILYSTEAKPHTLLARQEDHAGKKAPAILLVDHQDSFVHTLANYFRQTGATVVTRRAGFPPAIYDEFKPDLVVLSPGPGTPSDFFLAETIAECVRRELPIFGVCLGLQGIVEYFGGTLGVLDYPMHGKPSIVTHGTERVGIFRTLPQSFRVARYHSLYALDDLLPDCLCVTARSDDGVIMAIEHKQLPICAVQFHPESILTLENDNGLRMIERVVATLALHLEVSH